jgi:CHAD domain-containing protein
MFGRGGPEMLLAGALNDLTAQLPGLRDGHAAAIHDARVAIRRLREAVSLARWAYDDDLLDDVERRLAAMFKALGRARDADTEQGLVRHVEARFPSAAATLGLLRASVGRSQLRARRKVVKALEALEIQAIPKQLHRAHRPGHRIVRRGERWSSLLHTHVGHRADEARAAIEHAGGVYFRKRAHSARVAIKQLRYALELAGRSGVWEDRRAIRRLRKAQEWLGQAHDREVLIKRLSDLNGKGPTVSAGETQVVEQFLEGEVSGLHEQYLASRAEILEICNAFQISSSSTTTTRVVPVAAAVIAIPTFLMLRNHRQG